MLLPSTDFCPSWKRRVSVLRLFWQILVRPTKVPQIVPSNFDFFPSWGIHRLICISGPSLWGDSENWYKDIALLSWQNEIQLLILHPLISRVFVNRVSAMDFMAVHFIQGTLHNTVYAGNSPQRRDNRWSSHLYTRVLTVHGLPCGQDFARKKGPQELTVTTVNLECRGGVTAPRFLRLILSQVVACPRL